MTSQTTQATNRHVKAEELERGALELFRLTNNHGIAFRLFGSLAVRVHCPETKQLLDAGRRLPKDIDAAIPKQDRASLSVVIAGDWKEDVELTALTDGQTLRFIGRRNRIRLDVSVDCLRFSQTLDVSKRLKEDQPTVPLADLLLSKLQITDVVTYDLMDMSVLLLEHPLGHSDREEINCDRIASVVSTSWPWFHVIEVNLAKLLKFAPQWDVLKQSQVSMIKERIEDLSRLIHECPKSIQWKIRQVFGERIPWYSPVSET